MRALLARVSMALALASAPGCPDDGTPAKLSVTPAAVMATAGGSPIVFTATLTGSSAPISWALAPGDGAGTISPTSGPTTTYTPPASVPGSTLVTITASAGTLEAKATVTVRPIPRFGELLGVGGMPRDLAVANGQVFWSDVSDEPVKRVPAAGGTQTVVAHRAEQLAGFEVRSPHLVWLDLRAGIGATGCAGNDVIGALTRAAVDGTGVAQVAVRDACGGADGPVLDDASAFWITSEGSPLEWTVRQTPLGGGADTELAVSSKELGGLTRDAEALYWYEGRFSDPGSIVRRPIGGGDTSVVVTGTLDNPLSGVFTVSAGEVYFVELGYPYPYVFRVSRVPTGGGTPSRIAELSDRPFPAALHASGGELLWAEGDRIVAFSVSDGAERVVLAGAGQVLGFVVEEGDALAAVAPSLSRHDPATLLRVPLGGEDVVTLADGLEPVSALHVDGAHLYWAESSSSYDQLEGSGRLARIPLGGGAPETVFMGVGPYPALAAGGGRLWLGDGWRVKSVGLDGSGFAQLLHADDGIGDVEHTPYGGGSVLAMVGPFARVIRVPTAGGAPVVLHPGTGGPGGPLRVAGGLAYWLDSIDEIWRVPEGGGEAQQIAAGLAAATDLVADGEHVFVYENDAARIVRIPASGGPAVTLAGANHGVRTPLALDGRWLYWADPWGVYRVPKAGGTPEQIFALAADAEPTAIALDETSVYVTLTDCVVGIVGKITPK